MNEDQNESLNSSEIPSENFEGEDMVFRFTKLGHPLVILFFLTLFGLLVRFVHLSHWYKNKSICFYQNEPIMTTMDAYYYLRLTRDYLKGQYTPNDPISPIRVRPMPPPLLVSLTAFVHKLTNFSVTKIAFYLPCILSVFMSIPYFFWTRELGGNIALLVAGLIGVSSYYWYSRTCLGRFDTDSLIPFFVYIISYCVYKFSVDSSWKVRGCYLGLSLGLSWLFCLWWWPAEGLIPVLIFFPYALSIVDRKIPTGRGEQIIKVSLLVLGLFFIFCVIFNYTHFLPSGLQYIAVKLQAVFAFMSKKEQGNLPVVSISISELIPPGLDFVVKKVAGSWLNLLLSGIGIILIFRYRFRQVLFLLVPMGLSLLIFFGKRFLVYVVPIYALGMGFLSYFSYKLLNHYFPSQKKLISLSCTIFFTFIVVINAWPAFKYTISPCIKKQEIAILEPLMNKKGSGLLWLFWDYGYVASYFTQKPVIIDGGSQSPLRVYFTAAPLTFQNPILARNWIKFFAVHAEGGIHTVGRWLGTSDYYKIFSFLKKVFSSTKVALQEYPFLKDKKKIAYLFPKKKVYLYLPLNMCLSTAYWWYYYGTWDFYLSTGYRPRIYLINAFKVQLDTQNGILQINTQRVKINRSSIAQGDKLVIKEYHRNGYCLFVDGKKNIYYFDEDFSNSLFARLLFFYPQDTPGFSLLKYDPAWGGLWEVT